MALSNTLLSQFAKATAKKQDTPKESIVYGTSVTYNGKQYVRIDGSDLLTPVTTTTTVSDGDRVTVMIKDHTATITGNASDPSASTKKVDDQGAQITEFGTIMAHKVTTEELEAINATIENLVVKTANIQNADIINAEIENLKAKFADIEHLSAKDVEAINATIENLSAKFAEIGDLTVEELKAVNAEINNLKGYTADFTYVSADKLSAFRAEIKELDAKKLSAEEADIKYANIDFANIGEAAVEKLFAASGIIKDLVMSEGHVTGKLVGVTIIGDLIEGGTVKADKLVVLGTDGIYYKMNVEAGEFKDGEPVPEDSLHGSIITAKSITAEKVHVDDLVAFDATIGGFHIGDHSIYSGVKSSADNTTRGIFLGDDGQVTFGDSNNYLKYYKDQNGVYRLAISAGSIVLSASGKNVEEAIEEAKNVEVGARNLIRNSINMEFENYYFDDGKPPTLTATHDGNGNVSVYYERSSVSSDGTGNTALNKMSVSHDGEGNVTLTI